LKPLRLSFRKVFPRGLYARSVLMTLLPVTIILTLMTIYYYNGHLRAVNTKLIQAVARDVDFIDQTCQINESNMTAMAVIEARLSLRFDCDFRSDAEDARLTGWFPYRGDVRAVLEDQLRRPVEVALLSGRRVLDIRVISPEKTLRIEIDRKRALVINGHIFIVWVIAFSLFMVTTALAFLRNHVRSILSLTEATQSFGRGQSLSGFVPSGANEIRAAAKAVIEMGERLTGFTEQRTAMLTGVSHDLRTPLTRLKLHLAMQEQTEDVIAARADLEDMAAMLDEYLAFAKGEESERAQALDLDALVREVSGRFRDANLGLGVVMPVRIIGRPLALRRAISNLIVNATKYGTRTELTLVTDGERAILAVDDNGKGIAPELYETAFEPFTRLDDARTQNVAGTGLGLALSRDVARSHGGEISLDRSPLGGLRARLVLPL
jgi:two-component system osmolarity sensor histidine kinase EnvZ